jgi:RNA polymerase sigma-70 factor (ECF subfamily)
MHDPLLNQEQKRSGPFVSLLHEGKNDVSEIDSATFLKLTFEQNPAKGLELLFKRFYNPLCSHAVRFVYSKQLAEDLVSEVFFQFYRSKAYENISTSYTSYLFRSVRNECFTYMRREFGKMDTLDVTEENSISCYQQLPDAEIHYNNLFLKVNEVIARLPTQCQKVFLLSRFENKKYNEIANELHISPKTVEVHISKALKHLRSALHGEWMTSLGLAILSFAAI